MCLGVIVAGGRGAEWDFITLGPALPLEACTGVPKSVSVQPTLIMKVGLPNWSTEGMLGWGWGFFITEALVVACHGRCEHNTEIISSSITPNGK